MSILFLFRRDLRLEDNLTLIKALKASEPCIPTFILDPRQLKSPYRSEASVSFMIQSLKELDQDLKALGSKLHLFYGKADEVIQFLIKDASLKGLYLNKDYSPFSKQRDETLSQLCAEHSIKFHSEHDATLLPPDTLKTLQNKPYTVFTPFYKKALSHAISRPQKLPKSTSFKQIEHKKLRSINELEAVCELKQCDPLVKGGRQEGLKILSTIKRFAHYAHDRDIPSCHGTTRLSAHHKFGTISIRETYWAVRDCFGTQHTLINELFWRDFYTQILDHFPHVLGSNFNAKYSSIQWENDLKKFNAWKEGKTGFPIVDAGMRELNTTGWMHNRVRMITASFLVKDLHIDWRWGEKYFAQKLVDYDPAVNNGSWQWAASTGCDAQPYFRIFNPWSQQKKFDPDALYIKKWIPELKDTPSKQIHNWTGSLFYPSPIIDHAKENKKSKTLYGECH